MKQLFSLSLIFMLVFTSIRLVDAQAQTSNILDQTTVTTEDLLVTVNATGEIQAARTVPLTFGGIGIVSDVLVEEGDRVQAGDVLARLDAGDLEYGVRSAEIALQQQQIRFAQLTAPATEADIAVARAALTVAQASANAAYSSAPSANALEIARLQEELARNQLWQAQIQRDQAVAPNPEFRSSSTNDPQSQEAQLTAGLTRSELEISIAENNYTDVSSTGPDVGRLGQANASIIQAQIQLDQLLNGADESSVRIAEIALQNSELALQDAQLQLDDMLIVAPFDGVITANNLTVGERPPSPLPAFELSDTAQFVVELLIDETDVVRVEIGQPVSFTLDALADAHITGVIDHISLMPVEGTAVPVYEARALVDATSEPLRLSMSTTASIVLAEVRDTLIVPNRFIRLDRATQEAIVTVLDDNNRTREVVVTLGERNETHSQILSGLEAGQQIVLLDVADTTFSNQRNP